MTNSIHEIRQLGQSVWFDNIRRGLIESGELQRLIDVGLTGLTSNPTIFEKAISGSTDYDDALQELARAGKDTEEIYEELTIEDIQSAADLLRPTYDRTEGADGYASLEVDPHLAHDTETTISEAKRLFAALDRPNVMVKVPATPEGVPAVRSLIGEGINVNVTLIFSLESYRQVREAYVAGLEDLTEAGGDPRKTASVASFFVSRVDNAVDGLLKERIDQGQDELQESLGKAAVSNAKMAYRDFKDTFGDKRFAALRDKGARVQRPLWASTSTKDPSYSDVMYVESLIGRDTVNTMPDATLTAFLEHGVAAEALEQDVEGSETALRSIEQAGISMEQVTAKLLEDGVKAFADSFDQLLANIEGKRAELLGRDDERSDIALGEYARDVEGALADVTRDDLVKRIWGRDHTVWKPDADEVADRLGWLSVTDGMRERVGDLSAFAEELKRDGLRHVVLLGMGGSSLGSEVLRQTFGDTNGFPELTVLDSTVPEAVAAVTDSVEPETTLFLVSSKSGSTLEPDALYRHFRGVVEGAVGPDRAGQHFSAITDPGSPLEDLGREQGFRKIFLNQPDVGGRYSVLSYFGLVPAVLSGIDIGKLMERADSMRERCRQEAPSDNPGARLGAVMGALALRGRDKLTLVTSPSIEGFALWVEQLIAESTGKDGKGIAPVAGEPLLEPDHYGDDRLFVYLRLQGDDSSDADAATQRFESAGHPVVRLHLADRYDLGSEFFRWEFATAVAGATLGINPFDQPNVQQAKELTKQVLQEAQTSGQLPEADEVGSARELLANAHPGDYLAIMPYTHQTPEIDRALADLRRSVMRRHRIATTVGYGPRFLHSTGQLHKGGPDTGLFLQITANHPLDIDVPGRPRSFGEIANAQAIGDLRALKAQGRRVARVHIDTSGEAELKRLADDLSR